MLKIYLLYRWLYMCFGFTMIRSTVSDCPVPTETLPYGKMVFQSEEDVNVTIAPEGYMLTFKCFSGYTRIGPYVIVCWPDGWSDVVPTCVETKCPYLPGIENGKGELHSGINSLPTIGATAVYTCNFGYELLNETASTLTCVFDELSDTANWEGEIPFCKEKDLCPDPGVSEDGDREGDCCFAGDILQYSCKMDYEIFGQREIQCLSTGNWTSERPLCRPLDDHCQSPPAIPHGAVKGSKKGDYYRPYDEVEVFCEPGFSYRGLSQFILCEEEDKWEMEFGECAETFCSPPKPLASGTITELQATNLTSFPFNFEITYVCDKGFRLVGGDSWRFCDTTGWSGKTPYCEVIRCPDPGVPNYGAREGDNFLVGAKVLFKCFTGYYLIGSFERYCMPNGQWTGELTRCDIESNYCPDPGIPINAFKNSTSYNKGNIVSFRCRAGYTQLGSEVRVCLPNRTWSGQETNCLGPYDFDNRAQISDSLKVIVSEKAAEQDKMLLEYRQALNSTFHDESLNPRGRVLHINPAERLILYFLFDVSGSVGKANFRKSIDFAKAIVKKIGISESGARAGALTFSSKSETQFLPMNEFSTEGVLKAFDGIKYTGGGTSVSSALFTLREGVIPLTHQNLGTKGLKSVLFILTDGRANMGGDPEEEANLLKDAGLEIYCIGITGAVNKKYLYKIASVSTEEPQRRNVFILENYEILDYLVQNITKGTVDYSQCGLGLKAAGNQVTRARIVGGGTVIEPWPWMAVIYFRSYDPDDTQIQCGGSIIHQNFILTAAHCMYDKYRKIRKVENVFVKLGLAHVKNETFVQEPEVTKFYLHSKYKKRYDYDIALLQLTNPIEYNVYVRPICLPPKDVLPNSTFYKAKEYGLAAGWGHQGIVTLFENFEYDISDQLKEVILPIQSIERCKQSLVGKRDPKYFTDRMFCAGDRQGGNDTCHGDSGGPFMQSQLSEDGYLYWTQVGIVSWGIGCGLSNTYGFYTHVQQLREWIDKTIEGATAKDV